MIKVKAKLQLYRGENFRQTFFMTGYRPLFNFNQETKTSGKILLIDREELYPGEEAIVEIVFLNKNYLFNKLIKGGKVYFDEGNIPLGQIEIIKWEVERTEKI